MSEVIPFWSFIFPETDIHILYIIYIPIQCMGLIFPTSYAVEKIKIKITNSTIFFNHAKS